MPDIGGSAENVYETTLDRFYSETTKVIDDHGGTREVGLGCSIQRDQGRFLYDAVRKVQPAQVLEIGLAWGGSAVHIACAIHANGIGHHIALDPFQEGWSNIGARELTRLGFGNQFTCIYERSDECLPRFLSEGRRFQFIFIDGDHSFDAIMTDYYYSQKLLDIGGMIVFDDASSYTTEVVTSFIDSNMPNLKRVDAKFRRFAAFKKVDDDKRDNGHFVHFSTPKPGRGLIRVWRRWKARLGLEREPQYPAL